MEDFNTAAVAQEVLEDLLVQPEFGWAYLREFIPEGVEPTREQLEDLESLVMAASKKLIPHAAKAVQEAVGNE